MAIPSLASYPLPPKASLPANRVDWQADPNKAVLLIHDMQEYFVRFYGDDSQLIEQVQSNIAALRLWAKASGVPVVYTAQPVEQTQAQRALLNDMWGPGLTGADPELRQIVPSLAPDGDDLVLVKWRYSAFLRTSLQAFMQEQQRDQLLICGVYAHIGCLTTALDAFMLDIKPFMIADAVADFSEAEHQMALNYVTGRCGKVVSLAEILALKPAKAKLSLERLNASLATLLHDDITEMDPDDNLLDYGLDSVQVMTLVAEWEAAGVRVQFEELARLPTLNAWWALIAARQEAV
ncbi:isochorismatase family protein [Shewanella salipaludis]|uniref:isochorismatase n=1 Tax=Shewanella salipaludis TaxID=2723052 RepID=A0A972FPZ8_9GAMM|nr:isochorismatase family protein [Shewanella salipaludis]NMH63993.1 isochorismatase family protein [Shewanella salipaludis]